MSKNILEKYVNKKVKQMGKNIPKPDWKINEIDYCSILNSKFQVIPTHSLDREERMKKIKAKLDLSFLNGSDRRSVVLERREGSEREGLVFSKVNPIYSIDNNTRPNSFEWIPEELDRKLIDKMVREKDDFDKNQKKISEIKENIIEKSQKLH